MKIYWSLLLLNVIVWPMIAVMMLTASPTSDVISLVAEVAVVACLLPLIKNVNLKNKVSFLMAVFAVSLTMLLHHEVRSVVWVLLPQGICIAYLLSLKCCQHYSGRAGYLFVVVLLAYVWVSVAAPLANHLQIWWYSLSYPEINALSHELPLKDMVFSLLLQYGAASLVLPYMARQSHA